jgi:hypothetical protein
MVGSRETSVGMMILCLTSCLPSHSRASLFHTAPGKSKGSSVAWLSGLSYKLQQRQHSHQFIGRHRSVQSRRPDKQDRDGASVTAMRLKNDYSPVPFFKGWAKPGPEPPGIATTGLVVEEGETLDAICGTHTSRGLCHLA